MAPRCPARAGARPGPGRSAGRSGASTGGGGEPGATCADLGQAQDRLPRRRSDAHLARGDPPIPLRSGPGRPAARAQRLPALGSGASRVPRARTRGRRKSAVSPEIMISARPAEAEDRAVLGHWEGDLILGLRSSASGHARGAHHAVHDAVPPAAHARPRDGAAHEGRSTACRPRRRGGVLCRRQGDHDAARAAEAVAHLGVSHRVAMRSRPMANAPRWPGMTTCASSTTCPSASAIPRAPGSAAPTRTPTGGSRQHFPRGTDLSLHGPGELEAVALALNGRPRKTLGWRTPGEALDELLTTAQDAGVATTS